MPKKKIVIERKFRKTRKKIAIGIIFSSIGCFCLLIILVISTLRSFAIISPVGRGVWSYVPTGIQSNVEQTKILLNKYNIIFQSVTQEKDIIKICLSEDSEAWFSANKNIESQIASLQLTMNQFTIEGKKIKLIDFRYDKPVVVFEK